MSDTPGDSGPSLFGDPAPSGGGYLVLARKYRPRTFEDLIGQEAMVRTIGNSFTLDRIPHAYILTGVRGVGKTTTARLLARALNYESDTVKKPSIHLDPLGVHCREIMESRHPDVFEMDAASRTGIGDIREMLDGVRYAPVSARTKVYIIDEVHMLSTAAFNGLLKTLEEPPPHVKFIFATTEIRKVPVTVLSRCQRFDLKRVSPERLATHLTNICAAEHVKVDADGIALVARAAEGSVRDGLSLLDQAMVQKPDGGAVSAADIREMLGLADRLRVADLFEAVARGDAKSALIEIRAQYDAGADPALVLRDLLEIGHEAARVQALGADARVVGGQDWALRIRAIAVSLSPAQLSRLWQMLLKALEECTRAPEPIAAAEMALVRLCAAATIPPPEEIARMLRAGTASLQARSESGPEGPRSQSEGPKLETFNDVLALIDAARDIDLQIAVERFVRLVAFAPGRILFEPVAGMPDDLPARLSRKLADWTGVPWDVRADATGGVESFAESRARARAEALEELKRHPFVADALAAFPGAKIKDWRKPEPEETGDVVQLKPPTRPRRKEGQS
ncbi:MAG: DNA polymerase III subunit gamma/tau [Hyphomonadaceae bacterium]|nr:MAG: DNA polymerase III subunit gamma/tau [Caulobacteraceae bacterium]MBT9445359.1 DNA polymerase III subunit gamma/tau [Hyphomonadaceae bacterium]TPW05271.1 MAG: DNA polymerase III subunit gamma/tau [Alphaproteobacteria bacterium]